VSVTRLASACPAPIAPGSSFPWPQDCYSGSDQPDVAGLLTSGNDNFTPFWNQNAAMLDLATRTGSGGYALAYGGVVSAGTGLLASVTGLIAIMDGIVAKKSFADLSLPASTDPVWIWVKQDGTLQYTTTTTPPSSKCVLLGSLATDGTGVVGSIDTSGVVYMRSGMPYRETADVGRPSDSPDASLRLYTKTLAGLFLWSGSAWHLVPTFGRRAVTMSDANITLAAGEYDRPIIEMSGSLTAGRDVILPLYDGLERTVRNLTGQTLTFKGATGSGVAVAASKAARIYTDGSNWIRETADA